MTAVALTYDGDKFVCFADVQINFANTGKIDGFPKLRIINLSFKQLLEKEYRSVQFGAALIGSLVVSSAAVDLLSAYLSNLSTSGKEPPTANDILQLAEKLFQRVFEQAKPVLCENSLASILLFGFCPLAGVPFAGQISAEMNDGIIEVKNTVIDTRPNYISLYGTGGHSMYDELTKNKPRSAIWLHHSVLSEGMLSHLDSKTGRVWQVLLVESQKAYFPYTMQQDSENLKYEINFFGIPSDQLPRVTGFGLSEAYAIFPTLPYYKKNLPDNTVLTGKKG